MSRRKKIRSGQLIRTEELRRRLAEEGLEDVDPEAVVSAYIPRRRAKLFGAALLRMDRMRLFLLIAVAVLALLFILAFTQEKMGNFTINLDRLEMYRKGIAISADGSFTDPTARLIASSISEAYDTTWDYLPDNLDMVDGDHNGENYMAYTYYVRNAGKEDVGYVATVTIASKSKGAEQAVRVAVWQNGDLVIYAAPAADGGAEDGCVSFESDSVVCSYRVPDFKVGYVNRYTVAIWMEGEDPECVDGIVGGSVEFAMDIKADDSEETSLLQKFVRDIRDTLSGSKPISASGNESPDAYGAWGEGLTWDTRLNR